VSAPNKAVPNPRHQSSGRWQLGLSLALLTCLFWATLPVALKVSLEVLDPITLTWFRFLTAAIFTFLLLASRRQLGGFKGLGHVRWIMLGCAGLGLLGNYVLYLLGLKYTTPGNAQLLIQSAPLLLALGGIIWFKERINALQMLGFSAIVLGLCVFYFDQQNRAGALNYDYGAALIFIGALTWAIYALLQKQLLTRLRSQQVMLIMYVVCTILLSAFASPAQLLGNIDRAHTIAIGYCALNTIGAYGAFAEAMEHWDASRVSAILAITPVLTLITVALLAPIFPQYVKAEQLGYLGYIGAFLVVAGSISASLARRVPHA
jgi:drug/metabolite transporter (DMT)-like permease